jgi:serine protease Do
MWGKTCPARVTRWSTAFPSVCLWGRNLRCAFAKLLLVSMVIGALIGSDLVAGAQQSTPEFVTAEADFSRLTLDQRIHLQILLTSAGYWPAVPNADFSHRLFDAITKFQADHGFLPNGSLTSDQFERLESDSAPFLNQTDFQSVLHPIRGGAIWVPAGLGLTRQSTPSGFKYLDHANRLLLSYDYYPRFSVRLSFDATVRDLATKGYRIYYSKLYRDGFSQFFVVSAGSDNFDTYIRYHQMDDGGLGFSLYWDHNAAEIHGERIATLISGSLWSTMSGAPFAEPFTLRPKPQLATPSPSSAPTPQAVTPEMPKGASQNSGTGFFVTHDGLVLTNAHVVKDCSEIHITPEQDTAVVAQLLARDATNDLALLKTRTNSPHIAQLRPTVRLGEGVEAFGYPLTAVLATGGNFTLGNITALAGLKDDSRYLQISAPVQPGNSGGPLLDQSGNLVGIVSAKLNALNVMLATNGDIPQNVNFAIKASVAINFLQSNEVKFESGQSVLQLQPADIADEAKAMSVFVECRHD